MMAVAAKQDSRPPSDLRTKASNPEKWERLSHFRGSADCTIDIRANFRELPRANTN